MEHKHATLIKRWADDTSLLILYFDTRLEKWHTSGCQDKPQWEINTKYFLVCKKHKEVALHWLNGGLLEVLNGYGNWHVMPNFKQPFKGGYLIFTEIDYYRIKPTFETIKIWVGVNNKTGYFTASTDNLSDAYTWTEATVNKLVNT